MVDLLKKDVFELTKNPQLTVNEQCLHVSLREKWREGGGGGAGGGGRAPPPPREGYASELSFELAFRGAPTHRHGVGGLQA